MKTIIMALMMASCVYGQEVSVLAAKMMPSGDPPWLRITYLGTTLMPEATAITTSRRPKIVEIRPGIWQITFPEK